jgi:hypothetical protein
LNEICEICVWGDDAPWREIWQIYALVDHPWRVRFERDLCIGDDPLHREIWVRFVHLSIDIMMSTLRIAMDVGKRKSTDESRDDWES